jgi:hypothetical protein
MRVVEETWGRGNGNLINRERRLRGWSMLRGWKILGRYNSCDSILRAYVLCCSWSHEHGGPRN